MSTTDQPTIDAAACPADRGGWAVPGVEHTATATSPGPAAPGDPAGAATRGGWAVPGVDPEPAADAPAAASDPDPFTDAGVDANDEAEFEPEGPGRESPEAAERAVLDWRGELRAAVEAPGGPGGPGGRVAWVGRCIRWSPRSRRVWPRWTGFGRPGWAR